MPTWVFQVGGDDVTDDVLQDTVRITSTGYRGLATASFDVRDLDGTIDIAPEAEVIITRDGTREFGGLVRDRGRGIIGDTGKRIYRLTCQDFSTLLSDDVVDGATGRRLTSETDKARITWLLSTWGTKSVTAGSEVQAIETAMEPFDHRGLTLAECLDRICEETGATWYVDQYKKLHYFRTETSDAPFDFSDTPNGTTLRAYRDFLLPDETAGLVNAVWVRGNGIQGWRTDATSIAAYGRREGSIKAPRVKNQTQLARRGDAYLRKHANPRQSGRFKAWEAGGLRAGMRFELTNAAWGVSAETFRTQEVTLTISAPDGKAMYDVSFGNGRPSLGAGGAGRAADEIGAGLGDAVVDAVDRIEYVASAGPNLVPDSSAELLRGTDWTAGSWTVGSPQTGARHGGRVFAVTSAGGTISPLLSAAFIPVDRTRDHWISVWSRMEITSGTGRLKVLEYDAGGTLLATTTFGTLDADESGWTRHVLRLGDEETDEGPAFHASTTKIKLSADSVGAITCDWWLDCWQVEQSQVATSYLPMHSELAASSITDVTPFASTIRPVPIVNSLPTLPDSRYPVGQTVFLTTDGKLYRNVADVWTAAVAAADLTGQLVASQLADGAVTLAKHANGLRPIEVVASLPAAGTQGRTVLLTSDNKLYRDTGSAWTAAVPATDLTGQIVGTQITDGAITTPKMTANSISGDRIAAGTLDASKIVADSITAGQIAAGAISASEIAAGAITAEKLTIGTIHDSAVPNGSFEDVSSTDGTMAARWDKSGSTAGGTAYLQSSSPSPAAGSRYMVLRADSSADASVIATDQIIPVSGLETWYMGALCSGLSVSSRSGTGCVLEFLWYVDGVYHSVTNVVAQAWPSAWTRVEGAATVPAGINGMIPRVALFGGSVTGSPTWPMYCAVDDVQVRKASVSAQIADGAITTPKMVANSINGDRISAGTLDASKIVADSITAGQIQAGAIGTSELYSRAVTTEKLAVGNVRLGHDNPFFQGSTTGWVRATDGSASNLFYRQASDAGNYAPGGSLGVVYKADGSYIGCYSSAPVKVTPGSKFHVSWWHRATSTATAAMWVSFFGADGVTPVSGGGNAWRGTPPTSAAGGRETGTITVPSGAYYASCHPYLETNDRYYAFTDIRTSCDDNLNAAGGAVLINEDGVTIVNGKLVVASDSGGTVIIDGTSMMFKAAVIGTMSHTVADNGYTSTASAALTGLGTLSAAPAHLCFLSPGSAGTDSKFGSTAVSGNPDHWAGGSYGATATYKRFLGLTQLAEMFTYLDGSNYARVALVAGNVTGGSMTWYAKYYILKEAAM